MRFSLQAALAAFAFTSNVWAQVSTDCNPRDKDCPADLALGQYAQWDFTSSQLNPAVWNQTSTPITYNNDGAIFTISKSGDSPNMATNFYIFFGSVSVVMKASAGGGICSSIVLLSDDLDEVDWEFLGSNRTMVQTNYFGKGDTSSYDRGVYHTLPYAPQDEFHNYTLNWSKDQLDWIIDGKVIRTLKYGDANGGKNYPQTPMKFSLSQWAPGDPKNPKGVIEWAQQGTDYSKGPWSMAVKSAYIQDATSGAEYSYSDRTGSWQSIKVKAGQSAIVPELNRAIGPGAHWRALSPAVRIGIIAGSIAGFVLLCGVIAFCCIKSTRKGLREHQKAEADWAAQQLEAAEWQRKYNRDRASMIGSRGGMSSRGTQKSQHILHH